MLLNCLPGALDGEGDRRALGVLPQQLVDGGADRCVLLQGELVHVVGEEGRKIERGDATRLEEQG